MDNKLRQRVKDGEKKLLRIPYFLKNVVHKPKTQREWRTILKNITEAFYRRFWFYNPVKCSPTITVNRPIMRGSTEIYTCPGTNGSTHAFKRFSKTTNFFRYRYGRGGEFAQGLYAVLRYIGVRNRIVLGYWKGADALWIEAWNPWTKRWISLDPAFKHGYGHRFTRKHMYGVIALEHSRGSVIDRSRVYM